MCIEDSKVIVLENSSQQTRRSATVKAPFVQCRAIRHSGTSDPLCSSKPLRFTNKQTNTVVVPETPANCQYCVTRHSPQLLSTDFTVAEKELCQICFPHWWRGSALRRCDIEFQGSVSRLFEGAKRLYMQEFRGPKKHHLKTEALNAFEMWPNTKPQTLSHLAIPASSRSLLTSAHQPQELTSAKSLSYHLVLQTKPPSAL